LPHDPDDPAIWRHPADPARSLILGTDKEEGAGGLFVFRLDGTIAQAITPLDRPNNVDVEYGVDVGGGRGPMDVAVVTERKQRRLRVFGIPPDGGPLVDLVPAGLAVLADQPGEAGEPMGIALYKRATDGAVFAIVAPKTGPADGYLWQYRLVGGPAGPAAVFVRRFGAFDRTPRQGETGEIEAVAVDDLRGYVYYSDEWAAIRKYHADPAHPEASHELATFGRDGYLGDREGLAIVGGRDGGGYLVSSDQVAGGTRLKLYRRDGTAANPHDHAEVWTVPTASDETDGLDVTDPLPGYPDGLLVMMNSTARNFLLYDWRLVEAALREQHAGR
jgi:3-phytase